jgi:hypothetical protein
MKIMDLAYTLITGKIKIPIKSNILSSLKLISVVKEYLNLKIP